MLNFRVFMSSLLAAGLLLSAQPLAAEPGASAGTACPDIAGLVVIGEAEYVTIKSTDLRMKARIDTGAQTSSLGVVDQQPFERDGKKWLQFSVQDPNSGKKIEFEQPVVRIAEIKQHGREALKRPVVMMTVELGKVEMKREFSLADRSNYEYPVLIGRNVLGGKFVVDVNRKYSTHSAGGKEQ